MKANQSSSVSTLHWWIDFIQSDNHHQLHLMLCEQEQAYQFLALTVNALFIDCTEVRRNV
ncbi:hypothetical protein T4B_4399 [Trichinella pseudospiralis]|uniref:Uncharacterized protein n=1 Tax=Trichinella pseudospiralis TaxID=6337 RepID=A0A0V1I4L7_TRIPS|nr:hypothetical protein T4B_4399 [Trichinella pseudospiralis]KRZ35464.1 hypothetical protein T4C_9781 [Trichinella pseudospiralis]